jgi:hypothetical protein
MPEWLLAFTLAQVRALSSEVCKPPSPARFIQEGPKRRLVGQPVRPEIMEVIV